MHMSLKRLKKFAVMAIASLAVLPAAGQDLLANQAPIDRKMKVVDSLMLQQLITNEVWESPAAELYEDWDNIYAHKATSLPDSCTVNLRDFCMPTTSRLVTSNFGARTRKFAPAILSPSVVTLAAAPVHTCTSRPVSVVLP